MEREIKFRAWDNEDNQYFEDIEDVMLSGDGDIAIYQKDGDFDWGGYGIALEQYTGLKDINGVEIYENDIVRCSRGYPHQVVWEEERGGMFGGGMPGWYLSGLADGYAWTSSEEAIGNIHENPELLGEK